MSNLFPVFVASSHSSTVFIERQKALLSLPCVLLLVRKAVPEVGSQVAEEVVHQNESVLFALLVLGTTPLWFYRRYGRD